ncbi:MAG: S9 family peptidase [Candidatus Algichlamydia australiensis]|nr:S9 family peptidase [Chlamydiales bacterium]
MNIDISYGAWDSPVSAEVVVEKALRLGTVVSDGEYLYWLEGRPQEKGRNALMRYSPKGKEELLSDVNVRTRVHEYGGGAYTAAGNHIVFIDDKTQSLYHLDQNGNVKQLTPTDNRRYAEPVIDLKRGTVYAICEEHSDEIENYIVSVALEGGSEPKKLIEGHDFYSCIGISPDGEQFSYLAWNHPNLPWDATELHLNDFAGNDQIIAGENSSIALPKWGPDGKLYYTDDKEGFWSLYCYDSGEIEPLTTHIQGDFGEPQWIFGASRLIFDEDSIIAIYTVKGEDHLAIFNPETKTLIDLDLPYTYYSNLHKVGEKIAFIGAGPTNPAALYLYDKETKKTERLQVSKENVLKDESVSIPQSIAFPTAGGKEAYGFYYAPKNPNFKAPQNEKPPLIVRIHGGPTSMTPAIFSLVTQFWTTRGYAVLDVNYGGSTGYGREYRKRLNGNWGIVDVQDAIAGAKYLVNQGLADENRLAIRGGSAGGYTTIAALTFENYFHAGCSLFGICDLELLDACNHKFEHFYNHNLIGPYPEKKELYRERSPIHRVDELQTPLLILQGDEDKIVPPNQAEAVADALEKNGTPYKYILFEGEQHGFRKSENIMRALEEEYNFYTKTFEIKK